MRHLAVTGVGLLACLLVGRALAQQPVASVAVPSLAGQATPGASQPAAPAVYLTADEMPSFPGGEEALLKFLGRKLQYPTAALDRSLSGKVYVSFVVDADGHLHDPHVVKGLGSGLDEEALRLVRLMPWWTPGKIQGQPVWVSLTLPIVFRAL